MAKGPSHLPNIPTGIRRLLGPFAWQKLTENVKSSGSPGATLSACGGGGLPDGNKSQTAAAVFAELADLFPGWRRSSTTTLPFFDRLDVKRSESGGVKAVADAFENILGRPQVRDSCAPRWSRGVSHAYLFRARPVVNKDGRLRVPRRRAVPEGGLRPARR